MRSAISGTSPTLSFVGRWATSKMNAGHSLPFQLKVSPVVSTKSAVSTVIPVSHFAVEILGGSSKHEEKTRTMQIMEGRNSAIGERVITALG